MSVNRKKPHIKINPDKFRTKNQYQRPGGGDSSKKLGAPKAGRPVHASNLKSSIDKAVNTAVRRSAANKLSVPTARPGIYLEFESVPGWELAITSMEKTTTKDPHKHIEVVAVSEHTKGQVKTQKATVFVPLGEVGFFINKLQKYGLATPKKSRELRYENEFDRITDLRLATLRALWTDEPSAYPKDNNQKIWWEVWLRRTDGQEFMRLQEFAKLKKIGLGKRQLQFDNRIVTLMFATANELSSSLDLLDDLAEVQKAKETAKFFVDQNPREQKEWIDDLLERCQAERTEGPAVCILDTGVNCKHPLIENSLNPTDCQSVDSDWGTYDHHGHGTEMAGLALYGDLVPVLDSNEPVELKYGLESVKILPVAGSNEPDLYGAITAEAVSLTEIQAPRRRRVFSMAITAEDNRDRGKPTSWSSAVDALAAGRSFDPFSKGLIYIDEGEEPHQRLFVVSAGNIRATSLALACLDRSDIEPVQDPAQAWNVLTVGAFTNKVIINDPSWSGWSPLAQKGDLSPWSTTSVTFAKQWPIKPDVVMEGGNVVYDSAGNIDFPCEDLSLLTTHYKFTDKLLCLSWATSSATVQVARIGASVSAKYPDFWPETIRGLIVHSAEWTLAMKAHLQNANSKTALTQLVRRYGFGVPNLERAINSANNAVTLIVQDSIAPFEDGKMGNIHLHKLPWPCDVLASLGSTNVRVRVTLSYFIEPNPGRRGWQSKHRYQSHGLRFNIKSPTESFDEFHKRLNKIARDEKSSSPSTRGNTPDWYLGERARSSGSLHSDFFEGSAADIAEQGVIAVYPVSGWWKELKKRDRSKYGARYSLIVSIKTETINTDIWTPIATQVDLPIELLS